MRSERERKCIVRRGREIDGGGAHKYARGQFINDVLTEGGVMGAQYG